MGLALVESLQAPVHGDVPVGAVVVGPGGNIVASAHNERELRQDPTAHAEILALRAAAKKIGDWRLEGATLAVTLEPCLMCAGASVGARLQRLVYGATDPKAGACLSLYNVCDDPRLNHQLEVVPGVEQERCASQLTEFFACLRAGSV